MMLAAVQVHPKRLLTAQASSAKRQAESHQLPVKPSCKQQPSGSTAAADNAAADAAVVAGFNATLFGNAGGLN